VTGVLSGQPAAHRGFVERMRVVGRILAARNRRLGGPLSDDELADLTQETLLQIWRKLATYRGEASLETWAYRFCALELANHLRRRARAPRPLEDGPTPEEPAPAAEGDPGAGFAGELAALLRHLAPREAEVVRLVHADMLGFREAAEALAISVSSVKTHYYRGLEKLRAVLDAERGLREREDVVRRSVP
jgi:RNA polymerase sigma-70 factor (ECF subfamily)